MSAIEAENSEGDVVIQKRNPNLPEVVTKAPTFEEGLTRNNATIGSSDKFLGYGYKLYNGNYIPSDFDNFTHSILNIEAIKAYDESYVDENTLIGMTNRLIHTITLMITHIFQLKAKRLKLDFL